MVSAILQQQQNNYNNMMQEWVGPSSTEISNWFLANIHYFHTCEDRDRRTGHRTLSELQLNMQ